MSNVPEPYGDPLTAPFWEAARDHRLTVQHCRDCGRHQFYPRPFCLSCRSGNLEWVAASGLGTVYSITMVRIEVLPDLPPPYQVALVDLEEGPRLLAGTAGDDVHIGDRVQVVWKEREGEPPLPMFTASEQVRK